MQLAELVSYLDGYLRVAEVPDAPHALNGLQVANHGTVSRVAAAVDLCDATVGMAAEQGADLSWSTTVCSGVGSSRSPDARIGV